MKWKLLTALLGVFLAHAALATVPIYQNYDVLQYIIPGNPPPTIDAKAFDNENVFQVGFGAYTTSPELYEPKNTVNYTNFGTMIANSPGITNGAFFFGLGGSFGSGFQFDSLTTNLIPHRIAGTFYNPGVIRCDSLQDGNNVFSIDFGGGLVFTSFLVTSLGQFKTWATNVINSGSIDVGTGGLIQMTGQNVDLSGGHLTVEALLNSLLILGPVNFFNAFSTVTFNSFGAVGLNTNVLWNPGLSLTPVSAVSSYPYILSLSNSIAYTDDQLDPFNPNTTVHRAVFILNYSPNATVLANVYFDPLTSYSQFGSFYPGCVNVEWSANTIDPATGNPVNNYLYMTDDYVWGALTNAIVIGGVPDNFVFSTSPTQVLFGAAAPAPAVNFPFEFITNRYAYMNGTLTASSVNTNASGSNPSGTITNLPAAIKITASNTLNMAYTTIAGANYFSLNCTNQFDGSPGAAIAAPYSDIYLGVTNGFMTVSNLLMAALPNYSGNIQAWSTRWVEDDGFGQTNDYRVLLVYSALEPGTEPWIQHLKLYATNSLVISDQLNVYGSFYSDARSVTLNTNYVGNGATSLDGELTWLNPAAFNANTGSGLQQMPNLLWLTNNGAIRIAKTANFGSELTPQFAVIPSVPPVAATGKLSEAGTNVVKNDKVTIGPKQYTFVSTLTNATANQVKLATTFDGSMSNLIAAINHAAGSGSTYSSSTVANPLAQAGTLVNHAFTVTAVTAGTAGNSITTLFTPATASSNLTWSGFGTLANGVDLIPAITNYSAFINHGLLADVGTTIYTANFENSGTVSNSTGQFSLHSLTALLTNGNIVSGGKVTLVATNSLVISNHLIQAGQLLTLQSTNITDTGVTNGNIWVVGASSVGGLPGLSGFNIPLMPTNGAGDLLGTTVTNIAPSGKSIYNVWAGTNFGLSTRGFTNNLALGRLILDAKGTTRVIAPNTSFNFSGVGVSNALYVDYLEIMDSATNGNATNVYNFPWLTINTNMFIYYAQAVKNGISIAEPIDNASQHGANGGRLRWIYSYAGYFSSTNIVYPDGTTNGPFNAALAGSSTIDSDGDGIVNSADPTPFSTPFFLLSQINLTLTVTNLPPPAGPSVRVQWTTIPNATNFVYFTTNMFATNWLAFTNFISPQPYPGPATNIWVFDAITNVPHYYKVVVWPRLNYPY